MNACLEESNPRPSELTVKAKHFPVKPVYLAIVSDDGVKDLPLGIEI